MNNKELMKNQTQIDFQNVVEILKNSEGLRTDRLNTEALLSMHEQGRLVMDFDIDGELMKFGALWESADSNWVEIGTLWVNPKYRERGYSGEIFGELSQKANNLSLNVFLLSRSEKIANLARTFSFEEDGNWSNTDHWDNIYKGQKSSDKKFFYREFSK